VGSSSRGIWADSIIARISQIAPESRFFWWKTGQTRVIELIANIGTERIGFRFLPFQVLPLQSFMRDFDDWILHRQSKVRINYRRLARVAWHR
jgi:hypothetical protein